MTPTEYREARKAAGLTQSQLAEKLGITERTIQRREESEGKITAEAELAIQRLVELLVTGGAIIV